MSNRNPPMAAYDIALSAIRIRNTRARHQDTLYFRIGVSVDGTDIGTATWDGTGGRDKNNGYYDTLRNGDGKPIAVSTGPIEDSSLVKVSFIIMNSGHSPSEAEYGKALAAVSAAAGKIGGVWGYVASAVTGVLAFLVGANCDGAVAADSYVLSGEEIRERLGNNPYYNWGDVDGYIGRDSSDGCGSNSNYSVTLQLTRHP
jgi:hypothetical protein